jgi:hypothetical protein
MTVETQGEVFHVRPNHCVGTRLVAMLVFFLALLVGISEWTQSVASAPSEVDAESSSLYTNFAPSPSAAADASGAGSEHHQSAAVRHFERSLAKVQPLLERYGYGVAFAAVMAEGMGIPTPGQLLLMAGALEAAEGRMNITLYYF